MTSPRTKFVNRYFRPYLGDTPKGNNTFLGLCLVTLAVSLGLGVLPSLQTVITTKANLATGEADNLKLDKIIADLKTGQANLIKNAAKLKLLDGYIPAGEDYGGLIESVTLLASHDNVNLEFYQKDKTDGTSYWLGVSGSYGNLKQFMVDIENGQPLSRIDSVTLNMPTGTETQLKGLILVSTYHL